MLSGGEQALTALSLVFAVFLVNPSPICVLDEVDAPLDDANVTRFCGLLDELTKITKTKFKNDNNVKQKRNEKRTNSNLTSKLNVTLVERGRNCRSEINLNLHHHQANEYFGVGISFQLWSVQTRPSPR